MNVVRGGEPALLYIAEYTTNQSEDERDWHLGERSATLPECFIGWKLAPLRFSCLVLDNRVLCGA